MSVERELKRVSIGSGIGIQTSVDCTAFMKR